MVTIVLSAVLIGVAAVLCLLSVMMIRMRQKRFDMEMSIRGIRYDPRKDVLTVNDLKIAGDVLRFLGDNANSGDTFQFIEKKDGVLHVNVTRGKENEFVDKLIKDVTKGGEKSA